MEVGKGDFCRGEDTGLDMNDNDTIPTAKNKDEHSEEVTFSSSTLVSLSAAAKQKETNTKNFTWRENFKRGKKKCKNAALQVGLEPTASRLPGLN